MLLGRDTLLDAGPLIAVLDDRDQWHEAAKAAGSALLRRCVTTEAVVVEAAHFIGRRRGEPARVVEFLVGLDIPIVALHRPLHEECAALMRRYAGVPMDYADATLVALADRLGIRQIFTLDRRGFRQYRGTARRTPFTIVPAPSAMP